MSNKTVLSKTLLAATIAMLSACGGSDSNGGGQAPVSKTTVGVITGFGSIYVNGVEYETDDASIDIDGVQSIETQLGIGDVVVLQGSVNPDGLTGTATAVSSVDELEGYVLDMSGLVGGVGSVNIMGQTVTINVDTVFDGDTLATISDLTANDIVEVSGFSDGNGGILATRIETKDAAEDVEIKGLITGLDTEAMKFTIGSLTIDYSSASDLPANLGNDLLVEVKTDSALTGDLNTGFVMIASKVEVEDDGDIEIDGDDGDEIEMQGLVSDVTGSSFTFNGQVVEFDSLDIDDNFNVDSLTDGMLVTIEGSIDAEGNFTVEEIEEDYSTEDEVEGSVVSKTDTTVTILDNETGTELTILVNNNTRMIDEQDDDGLTPLHFFSLADVNVGEFVEVKFYTDEVSGDKIATELERDDGSSSTEAETETETEGEDDSSLTGTPAEI